MKIFVIYALAGIGHRRAAEAIFDYLQENYRDFDIKLIDALQYSNSFFRHSYTNGYYILSKYLPDVWKFAYHFTRLKSLYFISRRIRSLINFINAKKFAGFLVNENPDIIIATHLFAIDIISDLKRRNKVKTRLINVITDLNVHPFLVDKGVDEYIVALDSARQELINFGVPKDKIRVLGIPVDMRFTRQFDKRELRIKFGLKIDQFTVLIVTGAIGVGPIEKICDTLYKDVQFLVVCANNKRLYRRLINKHYTSLKVFGFVDNIEELMAASDIILTKPGGLTISECLSMELPLVFITEIPGQENRNAKALCDYAVAKKVEGPSSVREVILDYKNNPEKLTQIRENIARIKKPYATKDICDEVCKGCI